MIPTEDIEAARERDGDRGDVPNAAQEVLDQERHLVGFERGLPLLADSYEEYADDVLAPEAAPILEEGADVLGSTDDLAEELGVQGSKVRKALELHDVEPPTEGSSFDLEEDPDTIQVPLKGEVPLDQLRTPVHHDDRLLSHLYLRCEFGVGDIVELLEAERNRGLEGGSRWSVSESEVRSELEAAGLLEEREDATNSEFEGPNARGRLPSNTINVENEASPGSTNPGTNIDRDQVAGSDGVHFG